MMKEKMEKLFVGEGNYLYVDSKWVSENDVETYDALLAMLEDFVENNDNKCNNEDLESFKAGKWEVSYYFGTENDGSYKLYITAGRDDKMLQNQNPWLYEVDGIGGADFELLPIDLYLENL